MLTGLNVYEVEGTVVPNARVRTDGKETAARYAMAEELAAAAAAGHNMPVIEATKLKYVRDIGAGGFGAVQLHKYSDSGEEVAVKVNTHVAEVKAFVREAVFLSAYSHRNILRFVGVCPSMLAFATEFCGGGDALDLIQKGMRSVDLKQRLFILQGAANALAFLHNLEVAHRDIKPANILLTSDGKRVVLADFGLASHISQPIYGYTPRYGSPEQVTGSSGTLASDVYSFGVTMFEVS